MAQTKEQKRAWRAANREEILKRKRANYAANREKVLESQRLYYAANREKVLTRVLANRAADPEAHRDRRRAWRTANPSQLYRYGNVPARAAPLACEICGRRVPLVSEHDHRTGTWRGWTCKGCNNKIHVLDLPSGKLEALLAFQRRGGFPTFGDPDFEGGSGI